MMHDEHNTTKAPRWPVIDAARGAALLAMFVFHIGWDLSFFGLAPQTLETDPRFHAFGHTIAACFIGLAGVGLALAARHGVDWSQALRRIAKIGAAALGITIATYFIFPDSYIFFGILHLIAVAGLLCLPLIAAPSWLVALVAVIALAMPLFVGGPAFNGDALLWLGLGTKIPLTNDWRPLLPWLGVMLIGLLLGRMILARGLPAPLADWRPVTAPAKALVLGGRHTLLLYLVHQPIFIGIVFVISILVGPRYTASIATFRATCEQQCVTSGGQVALCARACGCIADGSEAQGIGGAVAQNRLSSEQRQKFDAITKVCIRREPVAP
jgi:uncharacterized membrane protein